MNYFKESNPEMSAPESIKMYQDLPEIVVTNGGVVKNEMEIDGKSGKMYCKMKYEFLTLLSYYPFLFFPIYSNELHIQQFFCLQILTHQIPFLL